MLWIDGAATPIRSALFEISLPNPRNPTWVSPGVTRAVEPRDIVYSLTITVDENSGEDGAAAPMIQSLPIWTALGGRHPGLLELGSLDLIETDDSDDWDAWFGNDAPRLVDNRLRFEGWSGFDLRLAWHARSEDGRAFYLDRTALQPGLFAFEGTVAFDGIGTCVDDPDDADRFVRAVWGEAQFASLRRSPGEIIEHQLPSGIRRLQQFRYMPVTALER